MRLTRVTAAALAGAGLAVTLALAEETTPTPIAPERPGVLPRQGPAYEATPIAPTGAPDSFPSVEDVAAAGRYWVTEPVAYPAEYVADGNGVTINRASVSVVNMGASPINARIDCYEEAGGRYFSNERNRIPPKGFKVFDVPREFTSPTGASSQPASFWCEIRADGPVIVGGRLRSSRSSEGRLRAETVTPFHVLLAGR